MKTSVAVGLGLAALCACGTPQVSSTSGDESSSGSGGAQTTVEDPTQVPDTDPIQTVTSETDADPTGSSTGDPSGSSTGDPSTGDACPGLIDAVAQKLTGPRCELLLVFDSEAALVGWHSACGEVPAPDIYDEKSALEATACCGDGGFLNDPITSPFVVFLPPQDPQSGGVAIVSNHLGAVVFEGSIGIDQAGTISVPDPLGPATGLADVGDCSTDSFSFPALASYHAGPGELAPDLEGKLAAAVAASLLPAALGQAGATVDRGVLLGYEDQAGAASSYVVLLELSAP